MTLKPNDLVLLRASSTKGSFSRAAEHRRTLIGAARPPSPEALVEHDTPRIRSRTGEPLPWVLTRGDARWEGIPQGRATVNSPEGAG